MHETHNAFLKGRMFKRTNAASEAGAGVDPWSSTASHNIVASLAGAASGLAASVYDIVVWYPASDYSTTAMRIPYVIITVVSSLIIAGLGGYALTRALAQTGALDRFPSGRARVAV